MIQGSLRQPRTISKCYASSCVFADAQDEGWPRLGDLASRAPSGLIATVAYARGITQAHV